jgi:glycosyltransferase involved in cell wall biosynthesis
MRILQVIASLDPQTGGPCEVAKQLATLIENAGHSSMIVTFDPPSAPWLKSLSNQVLAMGPALLGRYGYCPAFKAWLKTHASEFDAVMIHGLWQYFGKTARAVLKRSSTPYFIYPHGMLDPWFTKAYPFKFLKKLVYWCLFERRVLRDAKAVFFTSEEERRLSERSFPFYKCRQEVANYGITSPSMDAHLQRQLFLSRFPELKDKRILLFMGRLHPKKGCDLLIDAFAKVLKKDPDWRLVMAGPDEKNWRQALEKKVRLFEMTDRVVWTGMLDWAEKWGALAATEVFILPSHQENFGIAVAEALACGVPALISDKVNIWREILDAGAGFVDADDRAGTIRLLEKWLGASQEQKNQMRQNARRCFENYFDIEKLAGEWLKKLTPLAPLTLRGDV